MKPELSKKSSWWIPKERYYELKHRCLQYDFWNEACHRLDLKAQDPGRLKVLKSDIYDPVQETVAAREHWIRKIHEVDYACGVAAETDNSDSFAAFILRYAVTKGLSYEKLEAKFGTIMPRDQYYEMYRKFFWIMNNMVD